MIDEYQRIDDRSFSIRLKAPFAFTEFLLGGSNGVVGAIMREKDAMTDPFTQVKARIGSGPFRFIDAEYRPGAKLVYEKFDGYVPRSEPASGFAGGKVAKVDRVEWVIIPDTSVAFNALRSGEVDMLDAPPLDLLPTVAGDRNIVIGEVWPLESYAVLRFNSIHPPFNDVKARQAGGGTCVQPNRLHVGCLRRSEAMARMLCLLGMRQPKRHRGRIRTIPQT